MRTVRVPAGPSETARTAPSSSTRAGASTGPEPSSTRKCSVAVDSVSPKSSGSRTARGIADLRGGARRIARASGLAGDARDLREIVRERQRRPAPDLALRRKLRALRDRAETQRVGAAVLLGGGV